MNSPHAAAAKCELQFVFPFNCTNIELIRLLHESPSVKMEAAIQEPVGEDPLPHHVDEVEALAGEEPPSVAAVDPAVDMEEEKPQSQRHPVDALLIQRPKLHASTDVCHESSLLAFPYHPGGNACKQLKRGGSMGNLKCAGINTLVCKRSRPRYPVPMVPTDSRCAVCAPHLVSRGRRRDARPRCGTDPWSILSQSMSR